MRTSIIQVVTASLLACSGAVFGAELSDYEKTCLDLGFKKRTPAYGECVLELDKRSTDQQKQAERARVEQQRQAQEQQERQAAQQRQQQEQQRAARGDGTPDHFTCAGFGFTAGTTPYAECRMRVSIAKREEEVRQQNERAAAEQSARLAAEQRAAESEANNSRFRRALGSALIQNGLNGLNNNLNPKPTINCTTMPSMGYGMPSRTTCQ